MHAFVGRERELAALHERWRQSLDGSGSVLLVSADAGAGKSTLIGRFLTEVAAGGADALVITATCSEQYGAGEPYQPFVDAFRGLLAERGGRPRRFRDVARQLAPHWVAAIPVAGEVIAASMATVSELRSTFGRGGGAAAPSEEALFFQYTELFFAAAAEQPVLLFLDDLHWADRASVALLAHLGRRVADRRILIVGSYRPVDVDVERHPMRDARQELMRYGVAGELSLEPLDVDALAELVRTRANASPDTLLLDWLIRHAGGNALYFEELLGWLMTQDGATRVREGEIQLVNAPRDIDIPRTIESTIEKRLDRFDEDTRRVLEYASVQGDEFDSTSLAQLLDMDELALEDVLEPIARVHRFVVQGGTRDLPNGDIASIYRFAHSLFQDVLHASLQGKRRILLHRRMAQILETAHESDRASVANRLAVHFEEGRQQEQAFEYSLIAADRARTLYAHRDALDQIERALRNATMPVQRADAYRRFGEAYVSIARFADAVIAFGDALRELDAAGGGADAVRRLELLHRRLVAERNQGVRPVDDILVEMRALLDEASRAGAIAEQCRIIWHLIDLPGTTESIDIELARTALDLAEQTDDVWLRARGREVLGIALTFGGRPAEGTGELARAAELYATLEDRGREAGCRNNIALARMFVGELATAAAEFDAARAIFDDIVDPARGVATRTNVGAVHRMLGDFDAAEHALREAIRIARRLDVPVRLLSPVQNLAELHEDRAEWNDAELCWRELLQVATGTGYRGEQIIAHCGIGTARLRLDDLVGARASERAARALVPTGIEDLGESGDALRLFSARLAAAAGETDAAVAMLEHLWIGARGGDRFRAAEYRLEQAHVLAGASPQRATTFAEEARTAFLDMGLAFRADACSDLISRLQERAWASTES